MRRFLLLVALVLFTSSGCTYMENRGKDFLDCFKCSVDAGIGASARLQLGPIAAGIGYWDGYSLGHFGNRHSGTRHERYFALPFPLCTLGSLSVLLVERIFDSDGEVLSKMWGIPYSRGGCLTGRFVGIAGTLVTTEIIVFKLSQKPYDIDQTYIEDGIWSLLHVNTHVHKGKADWTGYFWVGFSIRCFVGIQAGFNIAEFADFILGWFGVDIADDDERPDEPENPKSAG